MKDKINIAITVVLLACVGIIIYILMKENSSESLRSSESVYVESREDVVTKMSPKTESRNGEANKETAQVLLEKIKVGWNLGNALDSCVDGSFRNTDGSRKSDFYETAWGNPVTTQEMIDMVSDAGFNAIRIPVTWYYNTYEQKGKLKVQESWLARVKEVVDYAYAKDMYVILNSQHDGEMIYADQNDYEKVAKNVEQLWSCIAMYFEAYDNHLIFGGMNELNDKENSWDNQEKYVEINNKLNQVYVDTVRSTGGNNKTRVLICGTYLNAVDDTALNGFVLPEDKTKNMLAAEVHVYNNMYNQELEEVLEHVDSFSQRVQAPVVIGEFGVSTDFEPARFRAEYAANFVYRASQHGMKCFWWDDGSQYQLLDRTNLEWIDEAIISGLMNPQPYETVYTKEGEYGADDDFIYKTINGETGVLEDSDWGVLTLAAESEGISVSVGKQYDISLKAIANAEGIKLKGVFFYDASGSFLGSIKVKDDISVSVTAPQKAAYMKVMMCNVFGRRAESAYRQYLKTGELSVTVRESEGVQQ